MSLCLSPANKADGWTISSWSRHSQDSLSFGSGSWWFPTLIGVNRHSLRYSGRLRSKKNESHHVLLRHWLASLTRPNLLCPTTPSVVQTDRHVRGGGSKTAQGSCAISELFTKWAKILSWCSFEWLSSKGFALPLSLSDKKRFKCICEAGPHSLTHWLYAFYLASWQCLARGNV